MDPLLPAVLNICTREGWDAVPSSTAKELPQLPYTTVRFHSTLTDECATAAECEERVGDIQIEHMNVKHRADLGYNFLVGGDGRVYEGRGWWTRSPQQAATDDVAILDIGFIGVLLDGQTPSTLMMNTARCLVDYGRQHKLIVEENLKEIQEWNNQISTSLCF